MCDDTQGHTWEVMTQGMHLSSCRTQDTETESPPKISGDHARTGNGEHRVIHCRYSTNWSNSFTEDSPDVRLFFLSFSHYRALLYIPVWYYRDSIPAAEPCHQKFVN